MGVCEAHGSCFSWSAHLLLAVCAVLSLAFLVVTARCSLRTVLTGMKPEVRCTTVASVVSLFVGVEKKTWPISHFCDRVNQDTCGQS